MDLKNRMSQYFTTQDLDVQAPDTVKGTGGPFDGAALICYSRRDAINDGCLVDLMQPEMIKLVREAGINVHAAMTATAFNQAVWPVDDVDGGEWLKARGQSLNGRLWDVLWMFKCQADGNQPECRFKLRIIDHVDKCNRVIILKAMIGSGDAGEPVITFMLPEED